VIGPSTSFTALSNKPFAHGYNALITRAGSAKELLPFTGFRMFGERWRVNVFGRLGAIDSAQWRPRTSYANLHPDRDYITVERATSWLSCMVVGFDKQVSRPLPSEVPERIDSISCYLHWCISTLGHHWRVRQFFVELCPAFQRLWSSNVTPGSISAPIVGDAGDLQVASSRGVPCARTHTVPLLPATKPPPLTSPLQSVWLF